ncbi:hypothetical protein EG327_003925 [Venturia inaequalis]|uniref:Uncharacterized protein n=1 Tax=Venturia inaequalis TaxID=5025 RepID=A0A8H3VSF0_VENIN|nr:hypothetical protein EG327_003925 [Venturia inaequalis]
MKLLLIPAVLGLFSQLASGCQCKSPSGQIDVKLSERACAPCGGSWNYLNRDKDQ